MNQPKPIQKGDTIAILSTARKISIQEILPAIELIHSWECKVVLGNTIESENHQFAGTDEERTENFQQFLDDENVAAIWCARGGYGTVRIIDQLDYTQFLKHPKWIIGYSDVTALHSQIHKLRHQSLHATMPINVAKNSVKSLVSLEHALFGKSLSYIVESVKENRLGKTSGKLIGGNLSMLYSLLGSPTAINTEGKILFLEDLDEYLYHIDRMLMNIKRNGYFDNLAGLIVGGMTDMHDNTIPFGKTAKEIILDITADYDFPICFDFPAGHVDDNRALIFGSEAHLTVSENNVGLTFES